MKPLEKSKMAKSSTRKAKTVSENTTPKVPVNGQSKTTRRASVEARISAGDRVSLYAVRHRLPASVRRACGLQLAFVSYFQDPFFAKMNPDQAFDEDVMVDWEPGLSDGPTSARFAVVDFDGDTGKLANPAVWDEARQKFVADGQELDPTMAQTP